MQYRTMPKNGDALSILGFGCMRLPMKDDRIDEPRAIRQIRDAIEKGVNYFDTAWPYHAGQSEPLLGRALQGGYRERVRVATKLPSWMIKSRADMDRYLSSQLEKLQTDHIDYYLLHTLDGALWKNLEPLGVIDFLDQAKRDGRIVNAGFSYHGLGEDFSRIVDAYPWTFCQIQYNFLDRAYQAGEAGLRYAASKGLGVVIMEPLRGGNIGLAQPPPAIASIWDESPVRRTPAEWALRWLWDQPEVTVVLSGMNDEAHIAENLATAEAARAHALTPAERALVDRAAQAYLRLMKVGCTGCGYCMPCPAHVAIPLCFEEYNRMHMFEDFEGGKFRYAFRLSGDLVDGVTSYASQCVSCGACLKKCPQHIPIPDILRQVTEDMEDAQMPGRVTAARQIFKVEA